MGGHPASRSSHLSPSVPPLSMRWGGGGFADRRGARGPWFGAAGWSVFSQKMKAKFSTCSSPFPQRMGKLRAGMSGGTCYSSKLVTSRDWLCLWLCPRLQRLLTLAQGLRAQSTHCPLPADSGPLPQLPYDMILCCHFLT